MRDPFAEADRREALKRKAAQAKVAVIPPSPAPQQAAPTPAASGPASSLLGTLHATCYAGSWHRCRVCLAVVTHCGSRRDHCLRRVCRRWLVWRRRNDTLIVWHNAGTGNGHSQLVWRRRWWGWPLWGKHPGLGCPGNLDAWQHSQHTAGAHQEMTARRLVGLACRMTNDTGVGGWIRGF
jgi:hypothetical protein